MADQTGETPVLDLLAGMTAQSVAVSSLDARTLMAVRIAALAAVGAPPLSYLSNLGAAADADLDADQLRGILTAIAPIIGTARVVEASTGILRAFGAALELAELAELAEEDDED